MFEELTVVVRGVHAEVLDLYWLLLTPLVIFLVVMEFLKGPKESIDVFDILRRVIISVLLLITFKTTINAMAMVGDGIVTKIDKTVDVWEVLKNLGPNYKSSSSSFFDLRGHIIYVLALLSYVIALVGFYVAEALTHFVWLVLYAISPLMILAYVPRATAGVTTNLYKGLLKVILWKILWVILGALLLKMAMNPQIDGMEDYILSIVVNLCIGVSMLFIPLATRSLINDGFESAASSMAALPTYAAGATTKAYARKLMQSGGKTAWGAGKFAAKPITNVVTSRFDRMKQDVKPKIDKWKKDYANLNKVKPYSKPTPKPADGKIRAVADARSNMERRKTQRNKRNNIT